MADIGAMRLRITLLAPTRLTDEYGTPSTGYADMGTVWASRVTTIGRPIGGGVAERNEVPVYHDYKVRFRPDIRNDWRLRMGATEYDVLACTDMEGLRRFLTIRVEERQ